jgi:hypothetical protein
MTTDDPDARAAVQAGSSEPFGPEAYREHPEEGAGPQDDLDRERVRVDRLQSHLQDALRKVDALRKTQQAATREAIAARREVEAFQKKAGCRLPVGDGPRRFVYGDENTIGWLRRELEWLADYREEGGSR